MIEGGHDTDGEGTTGIVEEKDRADRPPSSGGSGNALASGLQPGGIKPGGGPGATMGSIGTGGGFTLARAAAGIERVRRSVICRCSDFTLSTSSV